MKSTFLLVTICLLISITVGMHIKSNDGSPDEIMDEFPVPKRTKDLLRTVTYEGKTLHQSVDNQQGQITDQFVSPGGIRNTVHRNGVVVLDQLVTSEGVKQLVPQV